MARTWSSGSRAAPVSPRSRGPVLCDRCPSSSDRPLLADAWSARDRTGREQRVLAIVLFTDIVGARSEPPSSAIAVGATCSDSTMQPFGASSSVSGCRGRHSRRRFLRQLRRPCSRDLVCVRRGRDGPGTRDRGPSRSTHRECEVIDGKVAGIAVHTGARGAHKRSPVKCSSRARSATSWRGPASFRDQPVRAQGHPRASGSCMPPSTRHLRSIASDRHYGD